MATDGGNYVRWFWSAGAVRSLGWRRLEWTSAYNGHEIRVVTRGLLTATLTIDGQRRDARSPLLTWARGLPLLSARLPGRPSVEMLHVHLRRRVPLELELRVAGRRLATEVCRPGPESGP